jgi:hypothetical protein
LDADPPAQGVKIACRMTPPHLRQVSCRSGKISFVSTRTSLYCAPQFGQANGVTSVTGIAVAWLNNYSVSQMVIIRQMLVVAAVGRQTTRVSSRDSARSDLGRYTRRRQRVAFLKRKYLSTNFHAEGGERCGAGLSRADDATTSGGNGSSFRQHFRISTPPPYFKKVKDGHWH